MDHYIGIALNDDITEVSKDGESLCLSLPTVVCREKTDDRWLVGEEAYKRTLDGEGVIIDKLISLLRKDGTATIGKVRYTAREILGCFFRELLSELLGPEETPAEIPGIVVTVRKPEKKLLEAVYGALRDTGIPGSRIRLISHTEAFIHFVLHQDKNLYNRMVGMFELSNQCLYYYEMRAAGGQRKLAMAESEAQEEAFNLDILKTPSGGKIADRILTSLAERVMDRKSYSSVFLSGRGFQDTGFATNFMNYICRRRRVLIEPGMFAIGACIYAGEEEPGEHTILCDTRAALDVTVRVLVRDREQDFPIVQAGSSWWDQRMQMEMILDRQDYIDFSLASVTETSRKPVRLRMLLNGFPVRENRTTRVRLTASFLGADRLKVTVLDKGFGSLFPASGASVTEEIDFRKAMALKGGPDRTGR